MPFTEQLMVNLRMLLALDVLNPQTDGLSDSGRLLMNFSKQWLYYSIVLLRNKKDQDQTRGFIWSLSQAKISVNAGDIIQRGSYTKTRADSPADKQRSL